LNAGVQQYEDAPFAHENYEFLPGDYLYFTFEVAGFGVQSKNRGESRKISLAYDIAPQDMRGVAITQPVSGVIQEELAPEDKNWTPKRRASFLIPSFVAAGEFRVRVTVKDAVANTEVCKDFPFRIGGVQIQSSETLTVEHFAFYRTENDTQPLEVPAYSPGDTIYARFDIVGFKTGPDNQYHLAYDILVQQPNGKPYINRPHAAELNDKTFYPASFLPGVLDLTTSRSSAHGEYVVTITVHDLTGNGTYEMKTAFSIE
jgi:hypothetical protein